MYLGHTNIVPFAALGEKPSQLLLLAFKAEPDKGSKTDVPADGVKLPENCIAPKLYAIEEVAGIENLGIGGGPITGLSVACDPDLPGNNGLSVSSNILDETVSVAVDGVNNVLTAVSRVPPTILLAAAPRRLK